MAQLGQSSEQVSLAVQFRQTMLAYMALVLVHSGMAMEGVEQTAEDKAELLRAFSAAAHAGHALVEAAHATQN